MKRIGIMGGTFNPIHNGHIQIAKCAKEEYELDEIWFIPAGCPPHKQVQNFVSNEQRLHMTQLAIKGMEGFRLEDMELRSKEPSYSYLTLTRLKEQYPDTQWYFILGEDSLASFPNWVHPEIICSIAAILVAVRPENAHGILGGIDWEYHKMHAMIESYEAKYHGRFYLLRTPEIPISSSEIREKIRAGQSVSYDLNKEVEAYIMKEKLYQDTSVEVSIEELQKKMEQELKPTRYQHTLGVMYTAAALAMRYHYPIKPAMIAGVLHDCAKCLTDEERIKICKKQDIPMKEIEIKFPHLLHAKVGAYLAKEKYHVADADIIHAIQVHTTGCPQMNLLDKIIYAADYIEPNRDKAPRLDMVRTACFDNLEQGILMILEDTVHYLGEDSQLIDEVTLQTYEYYKERTT